MGNQVLSLSRKGFLTDVAERADRQYAYYLTSDKSQSFLYNGKILSLQATIQAVGNNQQKLQSQITQDINTLLGAIFDTATATITVGTPAWDGSNRFNITIQAVVTDNGVTYDLGSLLLQSDNGIVTKLTNANNG
jgi:hypothetical protein